MSKIMRALKATTKIFQISSSLVRTTGTTIGQTEHPKATRHGGWDIKERNMVRSWGSWRRMSIRRYQTRTHSGIYIDKNDEQKQWFQSYWSRTATNITQNKWRLSNNTKKSHKLNHIPGAGSVRAAAVRK